MSDEESIKYLQNWFLRRDNINNIDIHRQLNTMSKTPLILDNTIKSIACYIRNRWKILYREYVIPPNREVFLHERVHSLRAREQEKQIKELLHLRNKEDYYKKPEEIYARLFELRYLNNFDPLKLYTINDIRIDVGLLKICNEEQIYKLLNNIM